jgi:hypothetical protein
MLSMLTRQTVLKMFHFTGTKGIQNGAPGSSTGKAVLGIEKTKFKSCFVHCQQKPTGQKPTGHWRNGLSSSPEIAIPSRPPVQPEMSIVERTV